MSKRLSIAARALQHPMVAFQIEINTINLTQGFEKESPTWESVQAALEAFAIRAATLSIRGNIETPDLLTRRGVTEFANETTLRMMSQGIYGSMGAAAAKLKRSHPEIMREHGDFCEFFFSRIADSAGQVARMIQLGMDPKLLEDDSLEGFVDGVQKLAKDLGGAEVITVEL